MSENKTRSTDDDVLAFLNAVEPEKKREDSLVIKALMEEVTGEPAVLWGTIVGFGSYHYKYESGREGDMPLVGFSPRKQAITLYIMAGFEQYDDLMSKLGKHKTGKSCLYIKKTDDVDMDILRELVRQSAEHMRETNS